MIYHAFSRFWLQKRPQSAVSGPKGKLAGNRRGHRGGHQRDRPQTAFRATVKQIRAICSLALSPTAMSGLEPWSPLPRHTHRSYPTLENASEVDQRWVGGLRSLPGLGPGHSMLAFSSVLAPLWCTCPPLIASDRPSLISGGHPRVLRLHRTHRLPHLSTKPSVGAPLSHGHCSTRFHLRCSPIAPPSQWGIFVSGPHQRL